MPAPYQFEAIGTHWQIELLDASPADTEQILQAVHARIEQFDRHYSRFRPDSLVTQMSKRAGEYQLPPDGQELFDFYHRMYSVTDGAVTPLIGQVLSDAGYDAAYSLQPGAVTRPPRWEQVIGYDFPRLTLLRPALLDLGAAGKGYLVDIIGRLLHAHGVHEFVINAGGDMLHQTGQGRLLQVALEHPDNPGLAAGVATISGESLCGSAGNRRAWGYETQGDQPRYHHIISPMSLESPRHIAALWVVADSAIVADGLTTALYFTAPDILSQHFTYEYALLRPDGSLERSAGFPGEFYTESA